MVPMARCTYSPTARTARSCGWSRKNERAGRPTAVSRDAWRLRPAGGAVARRVERGKSGGDGVLLAAAPAVPRRGGQVAAETIVRGRDPRRRNGGRRRAPGDRALAWIQRVAGTLGVRRYGLPGWFCRSSV